MSIIGSNILAGAAGSDVGAYEIEQSLRLNKADTPYVNKVFSSAGDEQKFTISFWFKICHTGKSVADNLAGAGEGGSNYFLIDIEKSSVGEFLHIFNYTPANGYEFDLKTTRLIRDPSAWMHLVLAVDTTQATASNRAKVWLNGVQETSFTVENYPPQNRSNLWWGGNTTNGVALSSQETAIGRRPPGGPEYANAYIAEFNSIDGQYLTQDDFGEFDESGVWRPIQYTGTYTGNSFYLKFDASDVDGDSSGLSNDFTANNISTSGTGTDVMSDTPTTNWCTLSSIDKTNGGFGLKPDALSNGNLVDSSAYNAVSKGTIAVTSGKWYFEFTGWNSTSHKVGVALVPPTSSPVSNTDLKLLNYNGQYQSNAPTGTAGGTTYGGSISSTDIIGVAIDMDNRTIAWAVNGQYGDGSGNWDETYANASKINLESTGGVTPCCLNGSSTGTARTFNFGQRDFEYTPPTGFNALNTSNLPEPDIADGSDYFKPVLYTGDNTNQAITGVGFQSDFTWIKSRSSISDHILQDAVRGVQKFLISNSTDDEDTDGGTITSFDSDGFTIGSTNNKVAANNSGETFVAWNWLAGNGTSSNTDGTITSTVSASPTSGFSVATYTGTGSAATVGHGLGVAPDLILLKGRNLNSNGWKMRWSVLGDKYIDLNNTNLANDAGSNIWNDTAPTSTVFSIGTDYDTNNSSSTTYVAYCFAEVEGYSKFGSYTGTGGQQFVYLGFAPEFVMLRRSDSSSDTHSWYMFDATRDPINSNAAEPLMANKNFAEGTLPDGGSGSAGNVDFDFYSNGFGFPSYQGVGFNGSGATIIYAAFAKNPFGGSGVSPATAR